MIIPEKIWVSRTIFRANNILNDSGLRASIETNKSKQIGRGWGLQTNETRQISSGLIISNNCFKSNYVSLVQSHSVKTKGPNRLSRL